MKPLNKKNFIPEIKEHVLKEKPLLGIYLGIQMFFPLVMKLKTKELNLIKEEGIKLPENETKDKNFKILNVGWHQTMI